MLKNKTSQKMFSIFGIVLVLSLAIVVNSASALISQNTTSWFWTSDTNASVTAFGDVNSDGQNEIVTGGYYNDGTRWVAQLVVWNGSTLVAERVSNWFWIGDTQISSVAIANVTGGASLDIVTGGSYFDGTRWVAQLVVWNGNTLIVEKLSNWFWISNTVINSVAIGNYSGGTSLDIVTCGTFNDLLRDNAQLVVWNGTTLAVNTQTSWFTTAATSANSIVIGNLGFGNRLITGGQYWDNTRAVAQIVVWG